MQRGFIKLYRKIEDSTMWLDNEEPFDSRSAWIDLVLMANHKDNSFIMGLQKINIKRGQKWTSSIKLSNRWGWNRRKVMKYLRLLESEGMIYLEVTNRGLLITIVNYSLYQDFSKGERTTKGTAEGTTGAHQKVQQMHTNNNDKECNKNEDKKIKKKAPFSDSGKGGIVYEE